MWYLTTCKISVSLLFLNRIKNEMIFYRISELMLPTLIQRYDKKIISFLIQLTNWNFTGCQMPDFISDCINIIYQFIKPVLAKNKYLFLRNMEPISSYQCFFVIEKHLL